MAPQLAHATECILGIMKPRVPVRLLQLARETNLPARWLKREADAGRLPHLRVGRVRLFDVEAVNQALCARASNLEEPQP